MSMHNPPHPGEFIRSVYMEPFGISVRKLATRLAVSPSTLSRLLRGDSGVSPEMALRLSRVIGRSPESWLALQDAHDLLTRGRSELQIDLRSSDGARHALEVIAQADVLIEGFRPCVMERLGLGPSECHARNPRLVYGRMTGWGPHGPLAHAAGHDLNYIAISGALHAIGRCGLGGQHVCPQAASQPHLQQAPPHPPGHAARL
jgi:addiction module HigA family antidote